MKLAYTERRSLRLVLAPVFLAVSGCAGVVVADGRPYGHSYQVPPGQQPPPGNCYDLQRHIPPDADLIYGD